MGEKLGYIRVSSIMQNTDRQLDGMELDRVFEDKLSGKDTDREQLQELLRYARQGDTVYVHSLDRLGRNLDDLRKLVNQMTNKGITVHFVKEGFIFSSEDVNPMTKLMFNVLSAFSEFERELIRERQREGIQIAKANGVYKGRKQAMTPERIAEIKTRIAEKEPKAKIARDLGISRDTLYRYINQE